VNPRIIEFNNVNVAAYSRISWCEFYGFCYEVRNPKFCQFLRALSAVVLQEFVFRRDSSW
jgi:hypothetical protein